MNSRSIRPNLVPVHVGALVLALSLSLACSNDERPEARGGLDSVGNTTSPCADKDGDGFGVGCDTGRDCDDTNPNVTTDCLLASCSSTSTAPGCECSDTGATIDCGEVHQKVGDGVICGYGVQTCDNGTWSGCRISALPGRLRQALTAPAECPTNPCDPFCKEFLDSPNYSATPTGSALCSVTASCQDGQKNQNEVGIDCEGTCSKSCATVGALVSADFDTDADGFTYSDDIFRGTNAASSSSGTIGGGDALLTLGQVPLSGPNSGALSQLFTSDTSVEVTFDWTVTMAAGFLGDECGEVLVSVDGVLYGSGGDDFVASQCGAGSASGSFAFTSNSLSAGDHNLAVGGYLNKNAGSSAVTRLEVENYSSYNNPSADGNDAGRGGDTGFETSSDSDGSLNMGWVDAGDYVEWIYNAPVTGDYTVNARVASGGWSAWSQNVQLDGTTVDTLSGSNTGGYQSWQTVTGNSFSMSAGAHTLRLYSATALPNINYIEILEPTTGPEATISIDNVVVTSPSAGVCGDATCDASENCSTCVSDCGACPVDHFCGDATCDADESCSDCATDCGTCLANCGDGTCDADEGCGICETDCGACAPGPTCGDATCDPSEDCSTCASDCGVCQCGDTVCEGDEDCSTCASDCGQCTPAPACGDATCDADEDCSTCASDCGDCPVADCGDNLCNGAEDCSTCAADCGVCSTCGDATCDADEACGTCESDCGACNPTGVSEVFLEAECATTSTGGFANPSSSQAGYVGEGHIRSSGNNTDNPYANNSSDHATYAVNVANGTYSIYFRVETNASGTDDSWFYRIDNGGWTTENNHTDPGFTWVLGAGGSVALSGAHTIEIANRESGLDIDRIALLPVADAAPSGSGGAATNCETCGNNICEPIKGETCGSCATDCGACVVTDVCGDAICENAESCSNCETDCGACASDGCGDSICNGTEDCATCAADCGACAPAAACGDATCDAGENCTSCASDCGACPAATVCGDDTCDGSEDCSTCANDCGACAPGATCGDSTCDAGETCDSCAADCGACTDRIVCGDATCSDGETCSNCATDCTSCGPPPTCGDSTCGAGEDCANCAADCGQCGPSVCGNNVCESDENCQACPVDCGACIEMCAVAAPEGDRCGNSVCEGTAGEDCGTCPGDCGACAAPTGCGNGTCDPSSGEDCNTCPADCGACITQRYCGDGLCEPSIGESCSPDSCPADCGACTTTQVTTCGNTICEIGETCDSCSADCGGCPFFGTGDPFNGGIIATGTVFLGDRVTVNGSVVGRSLDIGNQSTITGSADSEADTKLRNGAVVGGTLRVGGSLEEQGDHSGVAMEVPADVTLPTIPGIVANPGGSNLTINNDQVVTIAPGRYQKLHVYSRARVTFTAGRYDFSAVQFEPEVDIVIDSSDGPVEWLVAGNVEFQSSTDFFVDNSLQWGVFSGGDITVRPGVAFPSPLYAPNGTITVFSNSTVNGGLAANNINLQPDITVGTGTINTGWGTPEPPPPSPPAPVCGDDDCTPETGESCSPSSCPQDCGACEVLPSCGDNTCDGDYQESCSTCAADCGACVVTSSCGDSTCDADQSENCSTCESDCGQCVAPLACGDNVCAAGETCSSCALDCGLCPAFETSVFTDTFEITEACNDDQTPLWAGLSWQATTPGDSKVNIYFRSAPTQAELDAAPEVLVGVAAASAGAGGWRYGPPEERAAMERGYQYLNDVNVAEGLPSHNHFGRLRFEIVPTSDGSQSSNLLDISLQSSCETIQ